MLQSRHVTCLLASGLGVVANVVGGWMLGRGGIMGVLECLAGVLGERLADSGHVHVAFLCASVGLSHSVALAVVLG
jgi:hypothetical protein